MTLKVIDVSRQLMNKYEVSDIEFKLYFLCVRIRFSQISSFVKIQVWCQNQFFLVDLAIRAPLTWKLLCSPQLHSLPVQLANSQPAISKTLPDASLTTEAPAISTNSRYEMVVSRMASSVPLGMLDDGSCEIDFFILERERVELVDVTDLQVARDVGACQNAGRGREENREDREKVVHLAVDHSEVRF